MEGGGGGAGKLTESPIRMMVHSFPYGSGAVLIAAKAYLRLASILKKRTHAVEAQQGTDARARITGTN